jgi:hypothetical protein
MRIGALLLLFVVAAGAQTPGFSDPSDVNPPVTRADLRIVLKAREILNSPDKWNRADNRQCPPAETTYSLYCALEKATIEVSGKFAHRGAVMQQARFAIDGVLAKGNHYQHRLMNYNNDPKTTFADVQKFFAILEDRVSKKLAAQTSP